MADEIKKNSENEAEEAKKTASEADDIVTEAEKKEHRIISDIVEIIESTLITVFVIVMIFTYLLHPVNVVGGSMNDTLINDDRIFMSTVYTGIRYGDIIVINNDAAYLFDENGELYEKDITGSRLNECIIKRVIGEPGQTVEIDTLAKQVIIDGKVLDEPYIKAPTDSGGVFSYPFTVPEGYYFVMGDNRNSSADSRDGDVGLIKKDQIYGKAIVRYSPLKDFKFLLF